MFDFLILIYLNGTSLMLACRDEQPDVPCVPIDYRANILIGQEKSPFIKVRTDLQPVFTHRNPDCFLKRFSTHRICLPVGKAWADVQLQS